MKVKCIQYEEVIEKNGIAIKLLIGYGNSRVWEKEKLSFKVFYMQE